jgi:hypothetical protein
LQVNAQMLQPGEVELVVDLLTRCLTRHAAAARL